MSKPAWIWAVVLAATVLMGMEHIATASSDHGLGLLADIMAKDPTQVILMTRWLFNVVFRNLTQN